MNYHEKSYEEKLNEKIERRKKEEAIWEIIFSVLVVAILLGMCIGAYFLNKKLKNSEQYKEPETVVEQEVPKEVSTETEKNNQNVTINIQNIENIENFDVDTLLKEGGVE